MLEPISYTERFIEVCPWYLHMGMSMEEYWHGEPWLASIYRQKHNYDIENRNQELWMQGLYIHAAVSVVIGNAFGKKGAKKSKYLAEPIRITPMSEEETRIRAENERRKAIAHFTKLEKSWRAKHQ